MTTVQPAGGRCRPPSGTMGLLPADCIAALTRCHNIARRAVSALAGRSPSSRPNGGEPSGREPGQRLRIGLYFFSLAGHGGAERMLLSLARALSARGHEVEIISLDPPGASAFHALPEGVLWSRLGHDQGWRGKLRRTFALAELLKKRRIDLLVGFVMGADKTVYLASMAAATPVVAAERNDPVIYHERLSAPRRWVYWTLFALCRRIAIQLPAYKRGYPRFLHGRIACIPNPVTPVPPVPKSGSKRGGVVLFLGRLVHQKGPDILIETFARMAADHSEWNLRIVGEGEARDRLAARIAALGLTDRVTFVGAVQDVAAEYRTADIFAFPSRYEGFPNALAEAMAHGLPSIALSDCKGSSALITHEGTGLLARDAVGFAACLDRLAGDPALRDRLGAAARTSIRDYDPGTIFDAWEKMLLDAWRG